MDRRTFNTALAGAAATSLFGCAAIANRSGGGKAAFFQCVGDQLALWDADIGEATLTRRTSLTMPSNVQYEIGRAHV